MFLLFGKLKSQTGALHDFNLKVVSFSIIRIALEIDKFHFSLIKILLEID